MGGGEIAKGPRARAVKAEGHGGAAVLVEAGLRIHQLFAGDHGARIQRVAGLRILRRRQGQAVRRRLRQHGVKGQMRGGADQRFQRLGTVEPRHLDQEAVFALPQDGGFAGARLVDAAAHDFKALRHDPVGQRGQPRFGEGDGQPPVLGAEAQLAAAVALHQIARHLQRGLHALGRGDGHRQRARRRLKPAHRAQLIAQRAQPVAQFGPERVHLAGGDAGHVHLRQQMRAAARV